MSAISGTRSLSEPARAAVAKLVTWGTGCHTLVGVRNQIGTSVETIYNGKLAVAFAFYNLLIGNENMKAARIVLAGIDRLLNGQG
jgi:hypothetical protein